MMKLYVFFFLILNKFQFLAHISECNPVVCMCVCVCVLI